MPFNSAHWNPKFIQKLYDKKDAFRGGRLTPTERQAWKMAQIERLKKERNQAPIAGPRSGMIGR